MAREINKLSARRVQTVAEPGRHSDGGGLYLVVDESGARRWVMLYRFAGKRREMGLGGVLSVPLIRARELAAEIRRKIADGVDPIEDRRTPPATLVHPTTFGEVADTYMADREATWRNKAHRRQWRETLEVQAATVWAKPVAEVRTEDVLSVLRPLWHTKAPTATKLRGRIERVLDAARAAGHRSGENPARWRGHLDAILPRPKKLVRGHHPALPYVDVPAFVAKLRERPAQVARMLELVILTAARSAEVRGIQWEEVDLQQALWVLPRERMKGNREHRVPLPASAVALLRACGVDGEPRKGLIFLNSHGKMHSDMAFTALLKRMGHNDVTTHGFRSSFRDWVDEKTEVPGEIAEAALAHLTGGETERAYRRGDALAKRRTLMDHWATFVEGSASTNA